MGEKIEFVSVKKVQISEYFSILTTNDYVFFYHRDMQILKAVGLVIATLNYSIIVPLRKSVACYAHLLLRFTLILGVLFAAGAQANSRFRWKGHGPASIEKSFSMIKNQIKICNIYIGP